MWQKMAWVFIGAGTLVLTGWGLWVELHLDAQPTMALVLLLETAGGHRGSVAKKLCGFGTAIPQTLVEQAVFTPQHLFQSLPADISPSLAIYLIADLHVIG